MQKLKLQVPEIVLLYDQLNLISLDCWKTTIFLVFPKKLNFKVPVNTKVCLLFVNLATTKIDTLIVLPKTVLSYRTFQFEKMTISCNNLAPILPIELILSVIAKLGRRSSLSKSKALQLLPSCGIPLSRLSTSAYKSITFMVLLFSRSCNEQIVLMFFNFYASIGAE